LQTFGRDAGGVDGAALHARVEGDVALSHGAALVLTGLGAGLPLLTLQPADRSWETWLVLPAVWAFVLWAARRLTGQLPATVPSQDQVGGAPTTGGRVTTSDRS